MEFLPSTLTISEFDPLLVLSRRIILLVTLWSTLRAIMVLWPQVRLATATLFVWLSNLVECILNMCRVWRLRTG